MKQKIVISSLARVNKNMPWRVGIYIDDNYTFFNVGENGNVAMSPRFHAFLGEIEKKVSRYPVDISFYQIKKDREMEVTKVRDQIVYMDCSFNSHRLINNARYYYDKQVMGNPLEIKYRPSNEVEMFMMQDVSESIASKALDYIAIARVEEVIDGDTVSVTLLKLSDLLTKHLNEDDRIEIRLNGVDTPEKRQSGAESYKNPKNTEFGKSFGVTMDDMYMIGDEATEFTKRLIGWSKSQKPLVVINFDREKDGKGPLTDSYGRYVSDMYATKEKNPEILMSKVSKGNSFVHVPKTLLTTYSTKFPHVPLGIYSFNYAVAGTSMLNPLDWASELNLQIFDPGKQLENIVDPDIIPDVEGDRVDLYETGLNTDTINFDSNVGPSQNNLDFFPPYDDRLSTFTKGIKTSDDLKRHDKVRIGDVILTIPPVAIDVNKTSTLHKVKTLRTKSSVLVNNGHTVTTLSMDLYFHDLDSINGTRYAWKKQYDKNEKKKYFYVDGLRPLLAQFASTPFVPIDNFYINDTLGIRDVALVDIEVSSVPNFPESLTARVTFAEFNSEAYLMDHASLGDSINYPLMRWYYNRSMTDRGQKYRYFKGLDRPIDSDITFTLADEEVLMARKNAIQYIKSADSPEKFKIEMQKNSSNVAKKADEEAVSTILRQYQTYKDANIKKYSVIDHITEGAINSLAKELVREYNIKVETAENAVREGIEIYATMYDGKLNNTGFLSKEKNVFIPYESKVYYSMRFDFSFWTGILLALQSEQLPVDYEDDIYKGTEKSGLFLIEQFADSDNQSKFEKQFGEYWNKKKKQFIIPATSNAVNALKQVIESSKAVDKIVEDYEKEFNSVLRVIETSEYGIPMKEYPISGANEGSIVPISLNVRFSNEFSMHHVQHGTAPTLQFMGGGDPYIDIILDVNEEAAKDINELINKSDYYAKTYNQGITNGYIGIKNNLTELFGIRYVMFESISINTIPGFPERFQVILKAIAFDKTQKQREELTAIPGNSQHMDVEMLKQNKNAFASDRLIESRLRESEIYPDLELPTYAELNAVLSDLDSGGIDEYTNLTGALYLDPDFYFSTISTFRQLVEEDYGGKHQLNMFDGTGVAAYTTSADAKNVFNMTAEDKKKIKELEGHEDVKPLGWVFDWGGDNDNGDSSSSASAGQKVSDQAGDLTLLNAEILDFLTKKDGDDKFAYESFPSRKEWERLFGPNSQYDIFKNKPAGSESLIYQHLNNMVDKYFKKYYSNPDFIKKCRGDLKDAPKSLKRVSYVAAEHLYGITYFARREELDYKSTKQVNKLQKEGKLQKPIVPDTITNGDWKKANKKITKERFMTLMKAFLDKMSGWNHYKGKSPMVSKAGRVGLAQVDISGKDITLDEAKRLMYNWKYNLEEAVKQLAKHFETFTKLKEDFSNFELYSRPWDAMFAKYEKTDTKIKTSKELMESSFVSGILNRFNFYATKPFNTPSGYNQDVYRGYAGLTWDEDIAIGNGNSHSYVRALLDLEYYELDVLKKVGLSVDSDKKNIRNAMEKFLEGLDEEALYEKYQKHLKMLYEFRQHEGSFFYIPGEKDKNGYKYSEDLIVKGAKLYEQIRLVDQTASASQAATDTRLYNDIDPHTLYQEMFHDMRHYDQRGRMARAFPGFQMFIIHEGQYFGKYKFWDNMYGFNAIESIDIYKSRKIAADTAIISMSNVYSNLTTRRTDVDYVDRQLKWWDNYIWNEIPQDLIDKKANEIHKNINLETGARIHLRMGYGGNAATLPVVFNGTISELEIGNVIELVAQGDGIELGNVISGDPDDDNDGLFSVTEPRDLICSLMSSKGSWLKDYFNGVSSGRLFRDNPLGIMHFGQPFNVEDSSASKPLGNILWYNDEYGEVAQNIYSSNGTPTFSQWLHPNGERNNIFSDLTWNNLWENKFKIFNPGDEKNVVVKFYNNTVWDIIQTIAYTSPDYIAAVHPFEQRSTLFFGKPYWRAAFQYDSRYEFDENNKTWSRHLVREARRPYMQHKFYTSDYDILQNNIKASEEGVFTNVVVNYDGKQTPVLYADADIRYDKQKTRVVEADIVAKFNDFYTSEVMATYFGNSVLRDNLKDMYKGNLLVLGDPTVKPHDMFFVGDEINDLQGNALVKAVTHHFSLETGFVTSIEPDLLVANDDMVILEMSKWYYSFAQSVLATVAIRAAANRAARNLVRWAVKPNGVPSSVGKWVSTKAFRDTMKLANDGSREMNAIMRTLDDIVKGGSAADINNLRTRLVGQFDDAFRSFTPSTGRASTIKNTSRKALLKAGGSFAKVLTRTDDITKVGKGALGVIRGLASFTPVGFIINSAIWIGTEMLFEHYRRFRENLQCVIAIPLTYRGKELTAGINNHAGMIYGDAPGRMDRLTGATFGQDDGDDVEGTFGGFMFELINAVTGTPGVYAEAEKTKELNQLANK